MSIYIAVDTSLSMSIGDEQSRFQYASLLAEKTADHLLKRLFKREITLVQLSHNSSILVDNVKSGAEVANALSSVKVTGSSDLISLFSLMNRENATKESVLLIIADASSFTTEEIKFSHLPECLIVIACVLDELEADTGQLARFIFLSAQVDTVSMSSLMKKGVFERYKPFFKSDFSNVENFAAALSETVIPSRDFNLRCGNLIASVQMVPTSPESRWDDIIEIIGFSKAVNLGNAPTSEHYYLKFREDIKESENPDSKAFLSLLSYSLISEEQTAICRLTSEAYGVISAIKNESGDFCLLLQAFPYGSNSVFWMKNMDQLISKPLTENDEFKLCIPSDGLSKPSYSTQRTIWDDSYGIQSDMQKILRLLKKIPDRQAAFYTELNRVHIHACTIGAEDIQNKLISLIEAEMENQNPLIKKHGTYVCALLKKMGMNDTTEILPPS